MPRVRKRREARKWQRSENIDAKGFGNEVAIGGEEGQRESTWRG